MLRLQNKNLFIILLMILPLPNISYPVSSSTAQSVFFDLNTVQVILLGDLSGKTTPSNYQEGPFLEHYCFLPDPHSSYFTFIVYCETHWFNESPDLIVSAPNQPSPSLPFWQKVDIGGWKTGKAGNGTYCVGEDTDQPTYLFRHSGLPGWNMFLQFKWMHFCEEILFISSKLCKGFHLYIISSVSIKYHWLQDSYTNPVKLLCVIFIHRRLLRQYAV